MVMASMKLTEIYLRKLKENDVYDNSVIIIMADHGYCYKNPSDDLRREDPILFVKGIGEKHEFQCSDKPVSFADLQGAYEKLLEGKLSNQIFDIDENSQRIRRYLYYEYMKEDHMWEYIQSGHVRDTESFVMTGKEYIR